MSKNLTAVGITAPPSEPPDTSACGPSLLVSRGFDPHLLEEPLVADLLSGAHGEAPREFARLIIGFRLEERARILLDPKPYTAVLGIGFPGVTSITQQRRVSLLSSPATRAFGQ